MVVYQFKLGGGILRGVDARSAFENPILWLCFAWLFGAAFIRWWVIPKTTRMQRLLVLAVVGLALSEAVTFHEIFLFPRDMPGTKMALFVASLLSAVQFMPVYAKRDSETEQG